MILSRYNLDDIRKNLMDPASFKPFPPAENRSEWHRLLESPFNKERKAWLVASAEALVGQPWPELSATLYMQFIRNGNRSNYQNPYFERRLRLSTLVLAECMEYQGRFLDEIINGFWHILGEPTWCLPAHAWRYDNDPLPREDRQHVDLFACETGMVVAESYYILKSELATLSHSLCNRIKKRVIDEIVEPLEQPNNFWWLAGKNNWSSWCSANALGAGLYVIDDKERAVNYIRILTEIVDRFINLYPEDGGCDEGPSYWGHAPGALLIFLEILHSYTKGAVSIYDEPKIKAMGEFIDKIHIDKCWFANFADANAQSKVNRFIIDKYGERVGSERMRNLAFSNSRMWSDSGEIQPYIILFGCGGLLTGGLRDLFWFKTGTRMATQKIPLEEWLPKLQIMVAREYPATSEGYSLVSKGGNNAENHNHNDVGQFILFSNGEPVIIDVGVSEYTKKTFSSERYDIWCIRASAHNVPLINGAEQFASEEAKAEDVEFISDNGVTSVRMELKSAYPKSADVDSVVRHLSLDRNKRQVALCDSIRCSRDKGTCVIILYSPIEPQVKDGCVVLKNEAVNEALEFDPKLMTYSSEMVELEDDWLRKTWGDHLYKIKFEAPIAAGEVDYTLTFRHLSVE